MSRSRILGIIILVCGIVLWGVAAYINNEVTRGKGEISSAQGKVDQANQLFSLSPQSKQVGKGITGSAQQQIDEGKLQVQKYEGIAAWLRIFGIIGVVGGILLVIFNGKLSRTGKR